MEKIFEIFLKVSGVVAPIIAAVIKWWDKHKEDIEALILRIEKDSSDADGWTKEEKEQLVLDLFYEKVYPTLPWWVRMIPKRIINSKIKKIIAKFCAKSHEKKGVVVKIAGTPHVEVK